jgi:hypothetical protein
MEGTTQEPQGTQGMPPPGALLDKIEAAVSQDPQAAREALGQVRQEIMNLTPEQKAQLREGAEKLVQRDQARSPEQQALLQEIVAMIRG